MDWIEIPVVVLPVTATPARELKAIVLPNAAEGPPIVLLLAPFKTLTPLPTLPIPIVPERSTPIRFPAIRLPVVPGSWRLTPSAELPLIVLAAAEIEPPIVLLEAPAAIATPELPLPEKPPGVFEPIWFDPITFPSTRMPLVGVPLPELWPWIRMPWPALPRIRLPEPGAVPPIVTPCEPLSRKMPAVVVTVESRARSPSRSSRSGCRPPGSARRHPGGRWS